MKKGKMIGIQRFTSFKGKRRIGIDTNIFIKLYNQPFLFDYEEARIFNYRDIIFTHSICRFELIKNLMREGKSKEEAKSETKSFLKQHNINVIFSKDCYIPQKKVKAFEKEANKKFEEMNRKDLECHQPDSIILLAFNKCGINKVISTDKSVRESAKLLGMDGSSLPSLNYTISRKMKQIFNYKHKHKKRKR